MRIGADNAIIFNPIGIDRTDRDTDGLLTIVAQQRQKRSSHVRVFALLNLLHPGLPHADMHIIFRFAGN